MPYATYKLLHLIGIVVLLLGLGVALSTAKGSGAGRRIGLLLHGVGLLLVLVAGFGLQAKGNVGFPAWLWAKIGAWVVLAFLPMVVRRSIVGAGTALVLAAAAAGAAVYLVLYRPF
jgi:hypothetical protein